MQVIPGINCPDFECLRRRINQVREIFESEPAFDEAAAGRWVHIDVADGRFTRTKTWNNPEELDFLGEEIQDLKLEIHLMVEEPQAAVEDWLRHGAARIIVQFEALKDGSLPPVQEIEGRWEIICDKIEREGRELALSISPATPVYVLTPYLKAVSLVQLLAVEPGPAGQKFNPIVVQKLKELKQREPDLKVEVDGGINLETAKLVKKAGADVIVSVSHLWGSENPKETFNKLKNV